MTLTVSKRSVYWGTKYEIDIEKELHPSPEPDLYYVVSDDPSPLRGQWNETSFLHRTFKNDEFHATYLVVVPWP